VHDGLFVAGNVRQLENDDRARVVFHAKRGRSQLEMSDVTPAKSAGVWFGRDAHSDFLKKESTSTPEVRQQVENEMTRARSRKPAGTRSSARLLNLKRHDRSKKHQAP